MRVKSQNKEINMPYELCGFNIKRNDLNSKINATYFSKEYIMAVYDTNDEALKALDDMDDYASRGQHEFRFPDKK